MGTAQTPHVTLGMPVYNGQQYLEETLDALLVQTFSDFELIISDNASNDGTQAICRRYAANDPRIRYTRQPENLGAAPNYNLLVKAARAPYFKWAAHDDLIEPTFLERCVAALDADESIALAYARVIHIDDDGLVIKQYDSGLNLRMPDPVDRFRRFFNAPEKCSPVFGLIRTDILRRTGLIGSYIASDRILLGELALHGKLYEVPEALFMRRIHALISTMANRKKRDLAAWFDPKDAHRFLYPTWKMLFEYLRAIRQAPLTAQQKRQCRAVVIGYFFPPRKIPYMLKELARAGVMLPATAGVSGVKRLFGTA